MSTRTRTILVAGLVSLGGCASPDVGLNSAHQPIVTPSIATVSGCPDWSDSNRPIQERQGANYGCATASNLAAMIADPMDLVRGKTSDQSASGEIAVRAVKAQRETQPSGKGGTIQQTSSKGN